MDTYELNSHKQGKSICLIVIGISFLLSILFGFLYYRQLGKRPLIKYPTYTLSTNDWVSGNVIITVTNPSEKISAYSFDGGVNFQDDNNYEAVENGNYIIVVKDIKGRLSEKITVTLRNIDKEPPIISMENPTTVQLGRQYNLKTGVIVTDEESGLNGEYTVTPRTIDTSTAGTYTITYTAFDKAGNYIEKQRTIIVKDIVGSTYYRYRTATNENYQCEPYNCNCVVTNTALTSKSCPTGYNYEAPDKCCQTCYKTCKKTTWSDWSEWSQTKVNPSTTVEVETKVE